VATLGWGARKLILVRHSLPEAVPGLPAHQWPLSETGRLLCAPLAARLAPHAPGIIVASMAPRALQTAQLLADYLGTPWVWAEGLEEHDQSESEPSVSAEFERSLLRFFQEHDRVIFGRESADAAYERFARAVERITESYRQVNVAIVSHATVMALFVARATSEAPFALWRRLGRPSFIVLSLPELELLELVEQVTEEDRPSPA
jgi:broad specificity phosphatase PhoE